jgi:hypothetical protein
MRRLFRRSAKLRRREDPSGVCTSRDGEERRQRMVKDDGWMAEEQERRQCMGRDDKWDDRD